MSRTGPFVTTALIIAAILPEIRGETPEMLPEPAAIASAVPAPLYRDPVYDGAADPVVVWNAPQRVWNILIEVGDLALRSGRWRGGGYQEFEERMTVHHSVPCPGCIVRAGYPCTVFVSRSL